MIRLLILSPVFVTALYGAVDSRHAITALASHNRATYLLDDWMRDPYIVLAPDGWFYLTCTRRSNIDGGKQGIQIWRSRDLVKWENLGTIWTVEDSKWMHALGPVARKMKRDFYLWAPELHFLDGRWVAVHTTSIRRANLLVTRGPELKAPFDEPMGKSFGHRHDPSIFTDDDGTHWLVWACAKIAPLKLDLSDFAAPAVNIGPSNRKMGHEGCVIRKIQDKYVLFGTAWSTDKMRHGTYNLYYCTADNVTGPYGPRKFAGRFLGHGTPFQDKKRRWWCTAFYNANVPPLSGEEAKTKDLSDNAYTINKQGLTLVPLDVRLEDNDVQIRAKDAEYAKPGPEEVQDF
jgi:arylsulfatase